LPSQFAKANKHLFIDTKITPRSTLEDLTVLIPTLGRPLLKQCLQSIVEGSFWPGHLIVVDQRSSLKVTSWLDALMNIGMSAEYLPSSQKGVAAGTNRGIERVRSRFVIVTHDDCIASPDWLECMGAKLRQHPEAIITGQVRPGSDGVVVSIKTSPISKIYTRRSLREDFLFPNNMGFSRSIYDTVGLFDESSFLLSAEDNDWSYRALRKGVPIIYAPEIVVEHLDWRDESQLLETFRAYARSEGGFYGKHLAHGDMFIALRSLIYIMRGLLRLGRGITTFDKDLIVNGGSSIVDFIPGIIAGICGSKK